MFYNKKIIIISLIYFIPLTYVFFWLLGWVNFTINDLFVLNMFDPATENYHFNNLYDYNSIYLGSDFNDLDHGTLINYPHFLENFTRIFFDNNYFPNARILTASSFYTLLVLIFIFSFYKTKNLIFSCLIITILYGWNTHIIYFQIFKPDIFYLLFGFFAILILFFLKGSYTSLIISSFFISLSLYAKQTGIIFLPISFLTLIYFSYKINEYKLIKELFFKLIIYFTFQIFFIFIIFYVFDKNSFKSFIIGQQLYANRGDVTHLISHLKYYFIYGYFILPSTIIILILYTKDINLKFYSLMLVFVTHLFSIKMWLNSGAFSNNFILISSVSVFNLILLFPNIANKFVKNFIILIIFLNSVYFTGIAKGQINFGYSYKVENSELLILLKDIKDDDQILSYNYYLLNFIKDIKTDLQYDLIMPLLVYDNPHFSQYYDKQQYQQYHDWNINLDRKFLNQINIKNINSIQQKTKKVDNKIVNKDYKFIIFSNKSMHEIHPSIKQNYILYKTISTNMGNFRNVKIEIYHPKK